MAGELWARRGPGWRGGRPRLPPFLGVLGMVSVVMLLLSSSSSTIPALPGFGPAAALATEEVGKECDKPCANGGRCQPGSGQCECQPGWVGDQCQHCGGRFRS